MRLDLVEISDNWIDPNDIRGLNFLNSFIKFPSIYFKICYTVLFGYSLSPENLS